MKFLRFFDWRFLVMLAVTGAVFGLVYVIVSGSIERREDRERTDVVLAQNAKLIDQIEQKDRRAVHDRHVLTAKYDGLLSVNKGLVDYLRSIGFVIPDRFIVAENARPETSGERNAREERESRRNDTANSGPDAPKGGGGSGGGGGGGGGGNDSDDDDGDKPGKSDDKSHGQNKGGKSEDHGGGKDKPKKDKGKD